MDSENGMHALEWAIYSRNEVDQDTLRPTRQNLGLSRGYVENWSKQDAFREYLQNW